MKKDYQYDLGFSEIADKEVMFIEGIGQANPNNPKQPRLFKEIEKEFFPSLKALGTIEYGPGSKWDDRKYRLNQPRKEDGKIIVPLGLTYFQAQEADENRGDDANKRLQEKGKTEYGDKWAFFARVLGVVFVPITTDGIIFIGEKLDGNTYRGMLSSAAGLVDYCGTPSIKKFRDQALKELQEEYGEKLEFFGEPKFVGLASHPLRGDADAVWVGRINVSSKYFTSGRWLKERKDAVHMPNLVKISSIGERDELLNELKLHGRRFKGIVYSTRLGLEALTKEHFVKL